MGGSFEMQVECTWMYPFSAIFCTKPKLDRKRFCIFTLVCQDNPVSLSGWECWTYCVRFLLYRLINQEQLSKFWLRMGSPCLWRAYVPFTLLHLDFWEGWCCNKSCRFKFILWDRWLSLFWLLLIILWWFFYFCRLFMLSSLEEYPSDICHHLDSLGRGAV